MDPAQPMVLGRAHTRSPEMLQQLAGSSLNTQRNKLKMQFLCIHKPGSVDIPQEEEANMHPEKQQKVNPHNNLMAMRTHSEWNMDVPGLFGVTSSFSVVGCILGMIKDLFSEFICDEKCGRK